MLSNINAAAKKIAETLSNFFAKEEKIEEDSKETVLSAVKNSDEKKIQELKSKINQL